MDEKIGGYDAKLTKRTREMREENIAYLEHYSRGQADAYPENVELAKEILGTFNMQHLKEVFYEYLKKSGVPIENANGVALERIFVYPREDASAVYESFENVIAFSISDKPFLEAKSYKSKEGTIPEELLMKMQIYFIHETCHAFSRNRIYSLGIDAPISKIRGESGYDIEESTYSEHTDEPPSELSRSLEAFNEGVTQRIAEEVFLEYQRRIGKSTEAERFLESFVRGNAESFWRYSICSNQVDFMCETIGEYVGVPKVVVWNSIKRGYFEKPELYNEGTIGLFEETFGKDFLKEHAALSNQTSIRDLAYFQCKQGFPPPNEYADKWLHHLGITQTPKE